MMGKKKCLVKVAGSEKYIVDVDRKIDSKDLQPNVRVALKDNSMLLHKILPSKIDPLVSLMKVEKVPDSTYDMIGGLD
jgi:26S proteasome regulatory subunit T6